MRRLRAAGAAGGAVAVAALLGGGLPVIAGTAPAARADTPPGTRCVLPPTAELPDRPWAQARLGIERVWPLSTGAGVTVAVVDTGVDGRHPLLSGRVLPGQDVKNGGRADTDCVGHGTLVAGLIAARASTGTGFAGVAPGVTVDPVREADNATDGTTGDLAHGIDAAVAAGARVINVSIVTGEDSPLVRAAVDGALRRDVVVVAAAGNDFGQGNPVQYPAGYPGVIAVGAVGADDTRAQFSQTGAVTVVAPGSAVTGPGAGGPGLVTGQSGTSYAAPFVSGVAALVRAYRPELSAAQVVHRIQVTADHPAAGPLPDPQLGWGEVDPYAAVSAVLPEEHGARPVTDAAVPLPAAPPPARADRSGMVAALAAGGGLAGAGLILAAAVVLPRARRRGWRPGRS